MSDYPKYQLSKFLDAKRTYQVVVRTDSFDELVESMQKLKPLVQQIEAKEVKHDAFEDGLPETITCKEHGQTMYKRDGKYGAYYSHKWGDKWCNLDAKKYKKGQQ